MSDRDWTTREQLIARLAKVDEERRAGRADRIIWLSQHQPPSSWVPGAVEALTLMQEARTCYVSGHFAATVLVASAFVEHKLSSALSAMGHITTSPPFGRLVQIARDRLRYSPELMDRCDHLREVRNALAHRRPPGDPYTLGTRYVAQSVHPDAVLEADAQVAMKVLYDFARSPALPV